MRAVKGLSEKDARLIVEKRGAEQTSYTSVRDIWLRTGLSPRVLERLADADGFGSLGLTRRQALWAVKALGRAGDQDDLPLLTLPSPLWGGIGGLRPPLNNNADARHRLRREASRGGGRDEIRRTGGGSCSYGEPAVDLPPMALGEEVVNDYRFLSMSLRAHPASFLRADLAARRVTANEELRARRSGERVTVSGLVTIRQRPGSANGVIFMTIEDETGIANIIVWPNVFERFRPIVLGARYVAASGKMQEECGVIHVVADRLEDLTALLARLTTDLPPIEALARADAVKRPHAEDRPQPRQPGRIPALSPLATDARELAADLDVPAHGSAHSPVRRMTRK
jgi:error-prone DNA polymerase